MLNATRASLLLLLVLFVLVLDVQAQTGPASLVSVKATRIDVNALPGRNNVIVITSANGLLSIVDSAGGAALVDPNTPGCSESAGVVSCPVPPKLRVKLGD